MSQAGVISIASGGGSTSFVEDVGSASPLAGVINVIGGSGIATSGSGNTITITATGAGFTWTTVAGTSQAVVKENGYINGNAGLTTFTLPATGSVGDSFQIAGFGTGGWTVAQNAGQVIHFNSVDTTIGVGGSLSSTNRYNTVEIMCIVANTDWTVLDSSGTLTVV